jgi:hypothetical protein
MLRLLRVAVLTLLANTLTAPLTHTLTHTVHAEVLYAQSVILNHKEWISDEGSEGVSYRVSEGVSDGGSGSYTLTHSHMIEEVEYYSYHDWEEMTLQESIYHFCYVHTILSDRCEAMYLTMVQAVAVEAPHLLTRHTPLHHSLTHSYTPRKHFYLLDMVSVHEQDMDWISELFPTTHHIHLLDPTLFLATHTHTHSTPSATTQQPLTLYDSQITPDILIVNAVSDIALVQEYIDTYNVLVLIHLSDEWSGKKIAHSLVTGVRTR